MTRSLVPLLSLVLAACSEVATERDDVAFANVAVTLPDETAVLPRLPGVEAVEANCSACHSPEMILTQPKLTRGQWEAQVSKMREVWKAPIAPEDEPAILGYLETLSAQPRP